MGLLDYDIYIIERKLLSWNKTSLIRDKNGNEIGKAINRETKRGEVTLYDSKGRVVGRLDGARLYGRYGRHVATLKKRLKFFRQWWIRDPKGNNAYEVKEFFRGFNVKDMNGKLVAVIKKKGLKPGHYTLEAKKINPLIPILFVLFNTILREKDTLKDIAKPI